MVFANELLEEGLGGGTVEDLTLDGEGLEYHLLGLQRSAKVNDIAAHKREVLDERLLLVLGREHPLLDAVDVLLDVVEFAEREAVELL